ncbi:MAG: hypothetical protein CML20_05010 [Rheinheimera sp.]|uniref:DUF3108 domain-containing protein n=1 Tax=Arsukibacterium sp. UBA3155 TaxID=1946058 RepID=UPI000C9930E8|nr:DUF3108 domain-containing protein [Arsukibacterium sp. UBA3155]MAD74145.1 hypothetical protein [Rheinheimera sp.]|tara:strand:+ start:18896 stop:19657 length:762 start_codon:yes stop_codon:yes gene_type:complete
MRTNFKWRLLASLLFTSLLTHSGLTYAQTPPTSATADQAGQFRLFSADYLVYRAGKNHGEANRYLKFSNDRYQMGYSSDISWLIFSDKRQETSEFVVENQQIQPLNYVMKRQGSGPSRHYELHLDPVKEQLLVGKSKELKADSWQDNWLDPLSYHQQLVLDLRAGKTEFFYDVLNRNGNSKTYHYKVVMEEPLALPYGTVHTLRIARMDDPEKQVYAWVAPELDYMLVRLWRGEDNVEQFDVQLHKLEFIAPQ